MYRKCGSMGRTLGCYLSRCLFALTVVLSGPDGYRQPSVLSLGAFGERLRAEDTAIALSLSCDNK